MSHLDRKKIDKLWKLYQEDQRPSAIGRKAGVHYRTVQRYIETGDQKNGIEAFKDRMKRITDKGDEKIADQLTADVNIVQRVLNAAARDMFKIEKKDGKDVIVGLKKPANVTDFDKLLRLKYFLSGEPDSRTETRLKGDVNQVISSVIAIIMKHVKDQRVRNSIADELIGLTNKDGDSRGAEESSLPN